MSRERRKRRRIRTREHKLRARVATAIRQAVRDVAPDMRQTPRTRVNWGWCVDVAIDPVLSPGREQTMFFHSARLVRSVSASIRKELAG